MRTLSAGVVGFACALGPFIYLGAKHMVTGYDHLLFLIGVIFFLYKARDIAVYVSLFSLGRSITLLFGVLSGVHLNPFLIDAIIGLSVVYKGLDNLGFFKEHVDVEPDTKAAVLVFGLFHGFGLATKLQDFHLSQDGLVSNIVAFNVGVEAGQILALGVLLIGMGAWRRTPSFTDQADNANRLLVVAGLGLAAYQLRADTSLSPSNKRRGRRAEQPEPLLLWHQGVCMRQQLSIATALALMTACAGGGGDIGVVDQRFPPSCEVVWPAEDGQILFGAGFELAVSISDRDTPPDELSFRAVSDLDGILPGTVQIDEIGATLGVSGTLLRDGYHTITVTVGDETEVTECATSFFIVPNTDPLVNFSGPDADGVYLSSENILVDISAFDEDETDQAVLELDWNGIAADQPTAPLNPDGDGISQWFLPRLPAGNYTIGVRVTDPVDGSRTASVAFSVIPTDGDGDGWIAAGDGGADCNDADFAINPAQLELCNGIDDDCDGEIDEDDAFEAPTWWVDADGDGYGDQTSGIVQCLKPAGYIAVGGDCDDVEVDINPGADETCDGVDQDCTGVVDDAPVDGFTYYSDIDGDTFGDVTAPTTACLPGPGVSTDATDCDDSDPFIHPVAEEACGNSLDDDCDGAIDEECFFEHCGVIDTAEVWSPTSTHRVTCAVEVQSTLTILDGVEVEFDGPTAEIRVGMLAPGRLIVMGSTPASVSLRPQGALASGGLVFGPFDTGSTLTGFTYGRPHPSRSAIVSEAPALVLADCTMTDGELDAVAVLPGAELFVDDCTIQRFGGDGIVIDGLLGDLTDTTITNNIGAPLELPPEEVSHIGTGNSFAGNWVERVRVTAGEVREDATWAALDVPYGIEDHLYVQGISIPELTIEPGAELVFPADRGLLVGWTKPGRLIVDAASDPVMLGSRSFMPSAGAWEGVRLGPFDQGSEMNGAVIEYATIGVRVYGSDERPVPPATLSNLSVEQSEEEGLWVEEFGSASIEDSTITRGREDGVRATGQLLSYQGNTISDNLAKALILPAGDLDLITGTNTYTGNADNRIHLSGTPSFTVDATFPAAPVPIVVYGEMEVDALSTPVLTLADGLEIQFSGSGGIVVANGKLDVEPGPNGVLLTSREPLPQPGDWQGVLFDEVGTLGPAGLDGLTIDYAGAWNGGALSFSRGDVPDVSGVTIRESSAHGIIVRDGGRVASITDCTIVDNVLSGIRTTRYGAVDVISANTLSGNQWPLNFDAPEVADAVLTDNVISGNTTDAIRLAVFAQSNEVRSDVLMRNVGIPWVVSGLIDLGHNTGPSWVIEAGTEVRFDSTGGMLVGNYAPGVLMVDGTATDPVLFTSSASSPAPGDWSSIQLAGDATGQMQHVIIEHGGRSSDGMSGLIKIEANSPYSLDNVELRHSGSYGIWGISLYLAQRPDISTVTFADNALGDVNW